MVDVMPFLVRESAHVRGIVPRVNRLAGALRGAGGTVAWVVPAYSPPTPKDREFFGEEVAERYGDVRPTSAVLDLVEAGSAQALDELVVGCRGQAGPPRVERGAEVQHLLAAQRSEAGDPPSFLNHEALDRGVGDLLAPASRDLLARKRVPVLGEHVGQSRDRRGLLYRDDAGHVPGAHGAQDVVATGHGGKSRRQGRPVASSLAEQSP
ncbi:hypothetical protein GCM10011376_14940 [Nocardioides flavus (ex Wang et al. 2016)]|uniref:Uncharacterized protein n=1 Tax=Nocardioides flavus (ex Wang et al. 2016) TaxID=2058780 RepID=A0ABQ3HJQ4_9ACTN|nr:hypothetical protein GCM10011376_14940 [Nocardioides flavus (ex Wang et al. 2016)]